MRHTVKIAVNGEEVRDWESYEIRSSLREPVSTAALESAFTGSRLAALPLGAEVQITIDNRAVFSGYLTSRTRAGHRLSVSCHDRLWRMVQDSAPPVRLRQETIQSLAQSLASGVFFQTVFSNARNRNLYGRDARRAGTEPPVFDRHGDPIKVPPGATKWSALAEVLRRAELLAWSSGDGKSLVLAKPNFNQEARYEFTVSDTEAGTCTDLTITESIEQAWKSVTVSGQSRVSDGRRTSVGENLSRSATVVDDTYPLDISRRIIDQVRSLEEARIVAQAMLDDGRATREIISIDAWQHAQSGRLYALDTVARARDTRNGYDQLVYVTGCTYRGSRNTEATQIEAVPLGTRVVIQ